jgi:hypothetical protein
MRCGVAGCFVSGASAISGVADAAGASDGTTSFAPHAHFALRPANSGFQR